MHAPVRGAGLASILLTFVVTGCHDEFPTPTSPNRGVEMAPAKALAPGPTRPDEARLAHFAALIPGFGGLSYGPDGELLVYLTDLAQSKAAEAALAQLADNSHAGGPKSGTITIRQGRYDFFQLQGWRDHLTDPLLNIPGVASLDLDEGENRLTVGLADPSAQALAQEKLREFGIPLEAVAFVPMGYPDASAPVVSGPYLSLAPSQSSSLQGYHRPLVGGLQLGFHTSDLSPDSIYVCTLGFIAVRDGVKVAVTASHCSEKSWDLDNTSYFQNQPGVGRYIGFEYLDPNGHSCGFLSINVCRNADAMAIDLDAEVEANQGYIAKTTYGGFSTGSLIINETDSVFPITATRVPLQGDSVGKVGRTTGWTTGKVADTCVDLAVDYRSHSKLRCQTYATFGKSGGDSGAPVFQENGDGTVALVGLLWGENDTYAIFSSIEQVEKDLGNLDFFAPGYKTPPTGGGCLGGTCPT